MRCRLRERAASSVALSLLEARQRHLDDLAICRLADVAVHQSDVAGSRDYGGLGQLPRIGNRVETPSGYPFTIPALLPCEAPVTMAVLCWPLMLFTSMGLGSTTERPRRKAGNS